ncbi:MAG TPA: serine/threonine-protein kinase [Kofleriaceae bacterium]
MAETLPEPQDPIPLAAGELVDGMTIVAARSRGGFAQLYEARLGSRSVAIKMLLPHHATEGNALHRLRLEASALAELDHPHIVEVFGLGEHRGATYIAMEWLAGRSLAAEIAACGALPIATTLAVFEQICGAVAAAHARGIVHRDLKADNVMVVADRDPVAVKLVDFGIAKLLRPGNPGITTSMQLLGTPLAMSPEQLLGWPIDERTDIYALGVLLFHCLTGRPPFSARTLVETEEMHLSAEPPRASDLIATPPALDAVIRRAMAKSPAARHPNVGAFLDDLRDALAARPAPRRGAAVYVEAASPGCSDDDLDAVDRALLDAQRLLRDAGFDIMADASNAILAGAALPGDGAELARRALAAAIAIGQPRMRVEIRVMVEVLEGTTSQLGPGALAGVPPGVFASAGALATSPELSGEPVADRADVLRVKRSCND